MSKNLGEESVRSLLFKLSVPAILSMMSAAIYNIVDRIFVARIDPLALTGVGITMPLQIIQMAFVLLIGIGSSTMISIKLGEDNTEDAEGILFAALKYIFISLILISIPMIVFIKPILRLLSVSPQVMGYATDYIVILLAGSIIGLPGFCINNTLRSIGHAKTSMMIIIISSVINIILDPILIFGFDMGIKGAAIATVISQMFVSIAVIGLFFIKKDFPVNLHFDHAKKSYQYLKMIVINGAPSFYMQILGTAVSVIFNTAVLKYGGDLYLAAFTIIGSIYSMYHMFIVGLVQGNQPICGFNYGAKKYLRVREALSLTLKLSLFISLVLQGILFLYPHIIIRMFTPDQQLIDITSQSVRLYLLMLPAAGLHTVISQYFQAVKKPRLASILLLLRYGIVLIPMLFIIPRFFSVQGVFISNAVSDLTAFLVAAYFVIKEFKKLSFEI